jgi:hypothetical protein
MVKHTRPSAVVEVAAIITLAFVFIWAVAPHLTMPNHRWEIVIFFATLSVYLGYISPVRMFRDSLASRGLGGRHTSYIRLDNLRGASRNYGAVAILGCLTILGASLWVHPDLWHRLDRQSFLLKFGFYLLSGTAQQLVFTGWLCVRLKGIFPETAAATGTPHRLWVCLTAALLAGAFHLPNPPLMIISSLGGFVFMWISYRSPNLFWAAIAHALLGTFLHRMTGLNMRIGPFYYQTDRHFFRTWIPVLQQLLDPLW